MKIIILLSLLAVVLTGAGCGKRTAYDMLRSRQEIECQNLHSADQEECYKQSGMSYDEYQKKLKERPADK